MKKLSLCQQYWKHNILFLVLNAVEIVNMVHQNSAANKDVSSANILMSQFILSRRSLMQAKKNNGPDTDPCGTQAETVAHSELFPFSAIRCF